MRTLHTPLCVAVRLRLCYGRHACRLWLLSGGVAGIAAFSATAFAYFRYYPSEAERLFVAKAVRAFSKSVDFDAKKLIYYTIPEFDIPVDAPIDAINSARGHDGNCSEADLIRLWARSVLQMHTQVLHATCALRVACRVCSEWCTFCARCCVVR